VDPQKVFLVTENVHFSTQTRKPSVKREIVLLQTCLYAVRHRSRTENVIILLI